MNPNLSSTSRKTCGKEAGHILLHAPGDREAVACRGVIEVEAEAVAYLLTAAHGLDASQYTFDYVAGWAHQAVVPDGPSVEEIVKSTGQRVIAAADQILLTTQTAPTPVDEALADLAVAVSRGMDVGTQPGLVAADTVQTRRPPLCQQRVWWPFDRTPILLIAPGKARRHLAGRPWMPSGASGAAVGSVRAGCASGSCGLS